MSRLVELEQKFEDHDELIFPCEWKNGHVCTLGASNVVRHGKADIEVGAREFSGSLQYLHRFLDLPAYDSGPWMALDAIVDWNDYDGNKRKVIRNLRNAADQWDKENA